MPTQAEILASLSAGKILANTKSWAEHGMTDAMRNKLPNMTWSEANKLNKIIKEMNIIRHQLTNDDNEYIDLLDRYHELVIKLEKEKK